MNATTIAPFTAAENITREGFDLIVETAAANGWTVDNSALTGYFVEYAADGRAARFVKGGEVTVVTWNKGGFICLGKELAEVLARLNG